MKVFDIEQVALEVKNTKIAALADNSEYLGLALVVAIFDVLERKNFDLVKIVAVRHLIKQVFRYRL